MQEVLSKKLAVMKWFKFFGSFGRVIPFPIRKSILEEVLFWTPRLGFGAIRTGLSLLEWENPGARKWIKYYIERIYERGLEIYLTINYFPPEKTKGKKQNSPPLDSSILADYFEEINKEIGYALGRVIWLNEWNLEYEYDRKEDPQLSILGASLKRAAAKTRELGKTPVLGGINKINGESLELLRLLFFQGILDAFSAMNIHGLRGTWSDREKPAPWKERCSILRKVMNECSGKDIPICIGEIGFATWDGDNSLHYSREELERIQVAVFAYSYEILKEGEVENMVWHEFKDMDPEEESARKIITGHEDPLQKYYGIFDSNRRMKFLGSLLMKGGPDYVLDYARKNGLMELAGVRLDRGGYPWEK